jgi:hypothetical protein
LTDVDYFTRSGFESKIQILLIVSHKTNYFLFLPFNLDVKYAMEFLSSVFVDAKFVSKSFKVAE